MAMQVISLLLPACLRIENNYMGSYMVLPLSYKCFWFSVYRQTQILWYYLPCFFLLTDIVPKLQLEELPEGWKELVHETGLSVYCHLATRVVTWARPYNLHGRYAKVCEYRTLDRQAHRTTLSCMWWYQTVLCRDHPTCFHFYISYCNGHNYWIQSTSLPHNPQSIFSPNSQK